MDYGASERGRDLPSVKQVVKASGIQWPRLDPISRSMVTGNVSYDPHRGYKFILQLSSPKAVTGWALGWLSSVIWEQSGLGTAELSPLGKISCGAPKWPRLTGNSHSDCTGGLSCRDSPGENGTPCKRKETTASDSPQSPTAMLPPTQWLTCPQAVQRTGSRQKQSSTGCKHNTRLSPVEDNGSSELPLPCSPTTGLKCSVTRSLHPCPGSTPAGMAFTLDFCSDILPACPHTSTVRGGYCQFHRARPQSHPSVSHMG